VTLPDMTDIGGGMGIGAGDGGAGDVAAAAAAGLGVSAAAEPLGVALGVTKDGSVFGWS
jgi:hypothetical protein